MKHNKILFIIPILLISVAISYPYQIKAKTNNNIYKARVLRVIDGDTLKVLINGKKESLRLIGIDAPESRKNRKAYRDAKRSNRDINTIIEMGKKATKYVLKLVKHGDIITVEFDVQFRDKYGRLLGYVYLSNGEMLNEKILKAGYATIMTIPPNVKYVSRFYKAYIEARKNRRGLWR